MLPSASTAETHSRPGHPNSPCRLMENSKRDPDCRAHSAVPQRVLDHGCHPSNHKFLHLGVYLLEADGFLDHTFDLHFVFWTPCARDLGIDIAKGVPHANLNAADCSSVQEVIDKVWHNIRVARLFPFFWLCIEDCIVLQSWHAVALCLRPTQCPPRLCGSLRASYLQTLRAG